jgi:pimeloyl-ACP methyl ester carboxylesterase
MAGEDTVVSFPGAEPPRRRMVDAAGVAIAVAEWGEAGAPPLFLGHGGFDFARTFDVFAPLLAAGGWRVVSWDQRGHGDSAWVELYSFLADVRDALAVIGAITKSPAPLVGHSKSGGIFTEIARLFPERVSALVNIDGLPSERRKRRAGEEESLPIEERVRRRDESLSEWFDHRRRTHEAERRAGSLDELARRRGRMNPRLSQEWLRYLVSVGARRDEDGWRWKTDPLLRFGGPGPWRIDWGLASLRQLDVPLLGILGTIPEEMGWGTSRDAISPFLPPDARLEVFAETGHFVHIEAPQRTAALILDFLASLPLDRAAARRPGSR